MGDRLLKINTVWYSSWEDCFEDFLIFKEAQGLANRTLKDYDWHIRKFFKEYADAWGDFRELKKAVLHYFAQGKDLAPATHNNRRKYLKAFFSWVVEEGIIPANPVDGIPLKREEPRVRELDESKLKKLLATPNTNTYSGLRDYALLCLTMDTGIRPKEALSLTTENINLRGMEVTVPASVAKTRYTRTLPITPVTVNAIRKLITVRPDAWKNIPLFTTAEGRSMSTNAWSHRLAYYSKKLGFKVSPYDLRHAFALLFLRNGGHALALQRTLGHADLAMTKRYVALTKEDMRKQHASASPLNHLVPNKRRLRKI